MDRGRRQIRHMRDDALDIGERPRRGLIADDGARLIDASHGEEMLDHETLLHLLCWRRWEVIFRPDGPAADLLAARGLDVGVANDRRGLVGGLHQEDLVQWAVFARALQAEDVRAIRRLRSSQTL